jgi:hypothetical protein
MSSDRKAAENTHILTRMKYVRFDEGEVATPLFYSIKGVRIACLPKTL